MSVLRLPLSMRPGRYLLLAPAFLLATFVSGCDGLVDRPALALEFGSPYNVLFGESVAGMNGLVQSTPFTDAQGSLHVAVEFTGGCADHTFRLDHTLAESTATVWLFHASNGEVCEELVIAEVVLGLPFEVLERETLTLVAPGGRDETVARFDAGTIDSSP